MVTLAEAQANHLPVEPQEIRAARAKPYTAGTESWTDYDQYRPKYPPELFERILAFHAAHGGDHALAVDLGSGPGTHAKWLLQHFARVLATDVGVHQLEIGKKAFEGDDRITFHEHSANDRFDLVSDGTASFVFASTAAHWFDPDKWVVEAARMLRSRGTLAWIGYNFPRITSHPAAEEVLLKWHVRVWNTFALVEAQDGDMTVVRRMWRDHNGSPHINLPKELWQDEHRIMFDAGPPVPGYRSLQAIMLDDDFVRQGVVTHEPFILKWPNCSVLSLQRLYETFGTQFDPINSLDEWADVRRKIAALTDDTFELSFPVTLCMASRK